MINSTPVIKSFNSQTAVQQNKSVEADKSNIPFKTVLNNSLNKTEKFGNQFKIQFSRHALERLDKRNINLSESDLFRISNGIKNVEEKGAHAALILLDEKAFIVSLKNQRIITALDNQAVTNRVFTNIDSATVV